ncbi:MULTISPECIES: hypothetical protein [Oscillatoriales]|uniref:hypothetical protein n=1 Tax=Limnospira platensis TaxID=118562 RepID=UPI0004A12C44|nr:hypothetical protein APPUASWS_021755 [Arthrospira platensis str. Paraca]
MLELRDLVKKDYAAFSRIVGDIDMAIALNFSDLPCAHKLRLARDIAKQSYGNILAINSRVRSGEDDNRGSGR